ncbi:response regulator [Synechococcales cyanobacterium C]|uniref:Response regulator n=1 Tax=Petrachloros mirabilis ULC683 TaxID=2781853 RepID=A0A8K2A7H5_9CYAN|nr:response regulator [Petrachloros mirabilis]NCJ06204.1 response regulator [Petrachloros mirabilis ULC683]
MIQNFVQAHQFAFRGQELVPQLIACSENVQNGYWQLRFTRLRRAKQQHCAHLGLVRGQLCYAGTQQWNSENLLKIVQRYIPQTRHESIKPYFARQQQSIKSQAVAPATLIAQMQAMGIVTLSQVQEALRLKVLNNFDIYLLLGEGEAVFIDDPNLPAQLPIAGYKVSELLYEAQQRQMLWQQLKPYVPSMGMVPMLNLEAIQRSQLPEAQRQWIQTVSKNGSSLHQIATALAKDSLEIAKFFAKLVNAGLVSLEQPTQATPSTVMIIDDSALVLSQFQSLVTALGYPVVVCQQAEQALAMMAQIKPAVAFVDINMPGITGFELVKQVRQQPMLSGTPLVILTGEQKLSNKWRAQWSGCEFLTKPMAMSEIDRFQTNLQELIQTLITAPDSPREAQKLSA